MFLDELKQGDWAVIEDLCDDCTCVKLIEMGCLPGEMVCIKMRAPFHGPIAIGVGGNLISLRRTEAKTIRIKQGVA